MQRPGFGRVLFFPPGRYWLPGILPLKILLVIPANQRRPGCFRNNPHSSF